MEHFVVTSDLQFSLPLGLSSDPEGLINIITNEAWKSLSVAARNELKNKYLPKYPESNDKQQEETLNMLFNSASFQFGNPLEEFVSMLWEGWFKPCTPPLLELQKKTQKVLKRKQMLEYHQQLLKDIVISRQSLIDVALQLGPSQPIRMKTRFLQSSTMRNAYQHEERTKRRYLHELQMIKNETGDDRRGLSSDDEKDIGMQDTGSLSSSKRSRKDGTQILYMGEERTGTVNTFTERNGYDEDPPFEVTDEMYRKMLKKYRKHRKKGQMVYEYNYDGITLADVIRRVKTHSLKTESSRRAESVLPVSQQIQSEISEETSTDGEETSNTGCVPVESDMDDSSPASDDEGAKDQENEEFETHACFFSLIRDVICSFEGQTATVSNLRSSIRSWEETSVAAVNDWFNLLPDGKWDSHLSSALAFLAGHSNLLSSSFSPYIEWQSSTKTYRWIATFRDDDTTLSGLNELWVSSLDLKKTAEINPLKEFHLQEKQRYQNPTKSFTYLLSGVKFTVGPVLELLRDAGPMKAENLLSKNRPSSVSFLSLVKDAVARLPRGQGTIVDIENLLLQSQYLSLSEDDCSNINVYIKSALDKIQTESDPCCKYDMQFNVWIYLHRERTEKEMERMYEILKNASTQSKLPEVKRKKLEDLPDMRRQVVTPIQGSTLSSGSMVINKFTQASAKPMELNGFGLVGTPRTSAMATVSSDIKAIPTLANGRTVSSMSASTAISVSSNRQRIIRHPVQVTRSTTPQPASLRQVVFQRSPVPPPLRQQRGATILVEAPDGTRRQITLPPGFHATRETISSLARVVQNTPGRGPIRLNTNWNLNQN
ncbi:nuclear factor related to kappa-B-binding protein-like [Artemia franciscana]|uniref:nuclear factor related to kappa-B-binding protein-like n=1 Tax=Artemia franciscana TaxID=6661 RepID=UPI0032DAB9F7